MLDVEATSNLTLPDGRPLGIANFSTIATSEIAGDRQVQAFAAELGRWMDTVRGGADNAANMFNRSVYVVPQTPYDNMRAARMAVQEDDIVSGVADATEALAFNGGLKWESADPDEADVFNQLSGDLNLDAKIREMWREVFTVDQFVCVKMWDWVTYTVRGNTEQGNKKKKKFRIWAPTQLRLLKPENCVPTGYGPLRKDLLAWQATVQEVGQYWASFDQNGGNQTETPDPLMSTFFTGQYDAGTDETVQFGKWGVNPSRLLTMNPDWVFRHTSTRPDYEKFPDVRLRGVFGLLDLKRQLMASDRATLIGAANYILLIRKGTKETPATQDEITNLKAGYNFLAKLPVIISDHRLDIDVIAPKLDFVLSKDAYDGLDARILARCLNTFVSTGGGRSAGPQAQDTFNDVLAAALENRRHMIKRSLEHHIGRAIIEHPRNANVFQEKPSLVFTPRTVAIGTNQPLLTAMLALRTQREISRDTILEHIGLDEQTEAQRLEYEKDHYDDIFMTQIPFAAPGAGGPPQSEVTAGPNAPVAPAGPTSTTTTKKAAPAAPAKTATPAKKATPNGTPEAPAVSGARGGRPAGGGTSKQSPQKQAKPVTKNGNPKTGS